MKFSILFRFAFPIYLCFYGNPCFCQGILSTDSGNYDSSTIRRGHLSNGLRYFIRRTDSGYDSFEFRLVLQVGSNNETPEELEFAHLIEHLGFRRLKHFPNGLADFASRNGLEFGKHVTGHTTGFSTAYKLSIPHSKTQLIDSSIFILKDWSHGIMLDSVEIGQERKIVLAERRNGFSGNSDNVYGSLLFAGTDFRYHSYDERNTNLMVFKNRSLSDFYKKWYCPVNQAAILIGDFDLDSIENRIIELFGSESNPPDCKRSIKSNEVRVAKKNYFVWSANSPRALTEVMINFRCETMSSKSSQNFKYRQAAKVYNQMMSSRLSTYAKSGLLNYHFITRNNINPEMDLDILSTSFSVSNLDSLENSFKRIYTEIMRVKKYGFSLTEFQAAKILVQKDNNEEALNDVSTTSQADALIEFFLNGHADLPPQQKKPLNENALDEISLSEINLFSKRWLNDSTRDIVVKTHSPEQRYHESDFLRWIDEVDTSDLKLYEFTSSNDVEIKLNRTDSTRIARQKSYSERFNDKAGVEEVKLSNGVTVIFKPFKPSEGVLKERIAISAGSLRGLSYYGFSDYNMGRFSPDIISCIGIGELNGESLSKYKVENEIVGGVYVRDNLAGFDLSCSLEKNSLESLLKLIYLYFYYPRWYPGLANGCFEDIIKQVFQRKDDPMELFSEIESENIFEGYRRITFPDSVKINSSDIDLFYKIYRSVFSNADNFTFVVSGNFDIKDIKPLMVRYLGSLPSIKEKTKKLQEKKIRIVKNDVRREVRLAKGQQAFVSLHYARNFRSFAESDSYLEIAARALQLVLMGRIRTLEGGTYSVPVSVSKFRDQYMFNISFTTDSSNVRRLILAVEQELSRLASGGLSNSLMDQAVALRDNSIRSNMRNNDLVSKHILKHYLSKGNIEEIDIGGGSVISNKKEAKRVIKRLFGKFRVFQFVLLPEVSQHREFNVK